MGKSTLDTASHPSSPLVFVLSKFAILVFCALFTFGSLAGCAPSTPEPPQGPSIDELKVQVASLPKGDATSGEKLFSDEGCQVCHSLQANVRVIGPSLSGVAERGATRKPNYTIEMYLYESIVYPNAFVVPGFQKNAMPVKFGQTLSQQQFADLVAFLLTK